jgi:hypothetical protein
MVKNKMDNKTRYKGINNFMVNIYLCEFNGKIG